MLWRSGTSSSGWRLALAHQLRYGSGIGIIALLERGDDARPVRRRAVLAQLELALEAADRDLDPDDAGQHRCDIRLGQRRHPPWHRFARLMPPGQPVDQI